MTTKQDYIGSILQGLAAITLSSPHHEFLAEIDRVIANFHREIDPKGFNTPHDSREAIEIPDGLRRPRRRQSMNAPTPQILTQFVYPPIQSISCR